MWSIEYLKSAIEDIKKLDYSQKLQVIKAIKKVSANPLPQSEGGYGKPLGNKGGINLSGYCKIKLKKSGLRIVYKVYRKNMKMIIIIISARADEEVYSSAQRRIK